MRATVIRTTAVGTPINVNGNQIESVPQHMASLWGVWEFDQPYLKGWSVGAGTRYIGSVVGRLQTSLRYRP